MTPKQKEAIIKHGNQLNAIFHTGLDPLTLCKKLRRIEGAAHKLAEDACNYPSVESEEYENRRIIIIRRLLGVLPKMKQSMFILNMDPRGYSLKIDNEYMRAHNIQLYRDLGGYGILAPEFGKDGE